MADQQTWHAITLMRVGPPHSVEGTVEVLAESREAALAYVREHRIDSLDKVGTISDGRVRVKDGQAS